MTYYYKCLEKKKKKKKIVASYFTLKKNFFIFSLTNILNKYPKSTIFFSDLKKKRHN